MIGDMTTKHKHDNPILVTGAAGAVGGIGRKLTESLLAKGHKVRAMVRREDERAQALRRLGHGLGRGLDRLRRDDRRRWAGPSDIATSRSRRGAKAFGG